MSKFTPSTGGKTARCSIATFLLLAILALTFSSAVQAQDHGVGIGKTCPDEVRTCFNDASCADPDACTVSECDLELDHIADCTFFIENQDTFFDTLTVSDAWDTVFATSTHVIPLAELEIVEVLNATCAPGPALPCTLDPPFPGDPGIIRFKASYELLQEDQTLVGALPDTATVLLKDNCDHPDTSGCNPDSQPLPQNFTAATDLVDGCVERDVGVECPLGNACQESGCDTETGCYINEIGDQCPVGNACQESGCDTETGCYINEIGDQCPVGNACQESGCDTETGCYVNEIGDQCPVGNACQESGCDTETGCYVNEIGDQCPVGNACQESGCDTETGCYVNEIGDQCPVGNACQESGCDTETGCYVNEIGDQCPVGNACQESGCDTETGCYVNEIGDQCPVGNACEESGCDTETGCYVNDISDQCPVAGFCQEAGCDETDGCWVRDIPGCGLNICRTPGFWATHGGDTKNRSEDITQAVMDYAGGLDVCGNTIATTNPDVLWSSSNAMCTAVKGKLERQLVRQLTAHALNCVMSGGDGDCLNTSEANLHTQCNLTCQNLPSEFTVNECIDQIDCFNNGGEWADGMCKTGGGICFDGEEYGDLCNSEDVCLGDEEQCVPDNCHTRELCLDEDNDVLCFQPPGPAGGVDNCKAAKKNGDYLPN